MSKKQDLWGYAHFFGANSEDFSATCQYCGKTLMGGEGCYRRDGKPYCEECVESADLEDLIRICETDTDELYRTVGLSHEYVGMDEA